MTDISDITNPNKKYINGPINVVRLEGNIGNTKKIIYLFMDFHISLGMQTKCENIFSTDIEKYLADNFYQLNEADHKYDFFFEIFPTEILNMKYNNRNDIYIEEVWKLFMKIFKIDEEKNLVKTPDIFQNVRFHYADIRTFFQMNDYNNLRMADQIAYSFWEEGFNEDDVKQIKELLNVVKNSYVKLLEIYQTKRKDKDIRPVIVDRFKKDVKIDPIVYMSYLFNKMKTKYNHTNVKKKLNNYLENHLDKTTDRIKEIDDLTNQIQYYFDVINENHGRLIKYPEGHWWYSLPINILREIKLNTINKTNNIFSEYIPFYAKIMDIYFLRRFLDKDYVTNGIVYTGGAHSLFYIYLLVKTFDFQITHVSYSQIENLKELNKKIKESQSDDDLGEWLYPPFVDQCSDMTHFPKNFE